MVGRELSYKVATHQPFVILLKNRPDPDGLLAILDGGWDGRAPENIRYRRQSENVNSLRVLRQVTQLGSPSIGQPAITRLAQAFRADLRQRAVGKRFCSRRRSCSMKTARR